MYENVPSHWWKVEKVNLKKKSTFLFHLSQHRVKTGSRNPRFVPLGVNLTQLHAQYETPDLHKYQFTFKTYKIQ